MEALILSELHQTLGGRFGAAPGDNTSTSYRSSRLVPVGTSRTRIVRAARSMAMTSVSVCTSTLKRCRNSSREATSNVRSSVMTSPT